MSFTLWVRIIATDSQHLVTLIQELIFVSHTRTHYILPAQPHTHIIKCCYVGKKGEWDILRDIYSQDVAVFQAVRRDLLNTMVFFKLK